MISPLHGFLITIAALFLIPFSAFAQTTTPASQPAPPTGLRILLIDPSHTDTADSLAANLSSLPNLTPFQRVDIPKLPAAAAQHWDVVVWLTPEPLLYAKTPADAAFN